MDRNDGEQPVCREKGISYWPLRRRFQRRQHALVPHRSFHSRPIAAARVCAVSNPYGHCRRYALLPSWFSRIHLPTSLPSARLSFSRLQRVTPQRYYGDSDSCTAHPPCRSPRLSHHTVLSFRLQPRGLPEHRFTHHASVPSEFRTSP